MSTLAPITHPTLEMLQAADAHTPVHLASFRGHLCVVEALDEAGWPLFTLDCEGLTPLHWALRKQRLDVVKYLCSNDVKCSATDSGDVQALEEAVKEARVIAAQWLERKSKAVPTGREVSAATRLWLLVTGLLLPKLRRFSCHFSA